jgi:hypothetical protein
LETEESELDTPQYIPSNSTHRTSVPCVVTRLAGRMLVRVLPLFGALDGSRGLTSLFCFLTQNVSGSRDRQLWMSMVA